MSAGSKAWPGDVDDPPVGPWMAPPTQVRRVTPEPPNFQKEDLPFASNAAQEETTPEPVMDEDAVWKKFDEEGDVLWFSDLKIAHDGGFGEVEALFTLDRFFWASVSMVMLIINLYFLCGLNIQTLVEKEWVLDTEKSKNIKHVHLIIDPIIGLFTHERVDPMIILAFLELALLLMLLFRTTSLLVAILLARCNEQTPRLWHRTVEIFWGRLPDLMTMSGMRLLNYVTPSIFIPALTQELKRGRERPWLTWLMYMSRFLLLRAIYGIIGFQAFQIKFVEAANCLDGPPLEAYICSLAFLNQMLGVVQINPLLQRRLFRYLFGGEDSFRSIKELRVQYVWCAMLARTIWNVSETRTMARLWFLAVMIAYTDMDFQRLTLNEKHLRKGEQSMMREFPASIQSMKNNVLSHEHV